MQYEILFDNELDRITVVGRGVAEVQDFALLAEDLINHEDFKPGVSVLQDYRDAHIADLSPKEIRSIASIASDRSLKFGKGRWAIVTADDVSFGMARMWYGLACNSLDIIANVFTDIDKATKWIESDEAGLG